MKPILTLAMMLLQFCAQSQKTEEWLGVSFQKVDGRSGAYYYGTIEKKDSLWQRTVWYISKQTMAMEGFYKDQACTIQHGVFNWYHPSLFLKTTGRYTDGKKEGPWLSYSDDGMLNDSSNYVGGRKQGVSLGWHKNGYTSDSSNFDGRGNGVEVRWHDDGSLAATGRWVQDTLKTGRWKYYHRNGTVQATEDYVMGNLQTCLCYNEQGKALDTATCREKEPMVERVKWIRFLERSLQSLVDQKAKQGLTGTFTVVIRFLVEKDGTVSNVVALTNYGYGIEEAVVALMAKAPRWQPGSIWGRAVRSYHTQPITFVIAP